ncbi:MAG: hypothetical protein R3D03_11310 [Geminicoccaceae bacterium]
MTGGDDGHEAEALVALEIEAAAALFCQSRAAAIALAAASLSHAPTGHGHGGHRRHVVMLRAHDHDRGAPTRSLLRLGGGGVREVGSLDRAGRDELEGALADRSSIGLYLTTDSFAEGRSIPPVHEMIHAARRHGLPSIVDVRGPADAVAMLDAGAGLVMTGVAGAAGVIAGDDARIAACRALFSGIGAVMTAHPAGVRQLLDQWLPRTDGQRPTLRFVPLAVRTYTAHADGTLLSACERGFLGPAS